MPRFAWLMVSLEYTYEMRLAVLRVCQVLSFDLVHLLCPGYQVRHQENGECDHDEL